MVIMIFPIIEQPCTCVLQVWWCLDNSQLFSPTYCFLLGHGHIADNGYEMYNKNGLKWPQTGETEKKCTY